MKNDRKQLESVDAMNVKTHWRKLVMSAAVASSIAFVGLVHTASFAQDTSQNAATLNFVNADIESVVKAIGHYTGTTFVIDPRVKGQLTLVSEKPLSKEQAFKLLTANLRMQGFAVVTADGFSKVVPETDAKLQGGPTQAKSVKGDQVVTQVFRINYEAANNIVTALRPLISPNNTINVTPGNNSIVITDYADNMRRMAEIIALLDVPANPELEVIPIKHAIAADIAAMANRLTEGNQAAGDSGRTIIMADSRTNSVLVKAPSQARSNLVKTLVAKLDQPTELPGNVHVVYLKNAEAVKLAATLRSIVTGESSNVNSSNSNSSNLSSNGLSSNNSVMPQQGNNSALASSGNNLSLPVSTSGNSQGASGGSGFIQADQATNTLIITASDAVYRNLRAVIDQLDARRAQVYIETLIVEVSNDKLDELGVSWAGITGDANSKYRLGGLTSFKNDAGVAALAGTAADMKSAVAAKGFSVGLFRQVGGQLGLGALAHALSTDGSSNVLSIPTLITLDNEEASIVDGRSVGFITGQYTSSSTGTAGQNPFQTVERREIGIKLKVRPQISEGGTVKLALVQEVSDLNNESIGVGPTTIVRSISTNVLAEDGQIVVLGGLLKDKSSDIGEKVPLLGDIPLIGNLFKYKKREKQKTNLMVFLRPVVVRDAQQSSSVSLDRYDYLKTEYLEAKGQESSSLFLKMEKGKLLKFPDVSEKTNSVSKEGQ